MFLIDNCWRWKGESAKPYKRPPKSYLCSKCICKPIGIDKEDSSIIEFGLWSHLITVTLLVIVYQIPCLGI